MVRVFTSTVINAPIDKVWAIARQFGLNWNNPDLTITIADGKSQAEVGCVRTIKVPTGQEFIERLTRLDDHRHELQYHLFISPFPCTHYYGEIAARPVTDSNQT